MKKTIIIFIIFIICIVSTIACNQKADSHKKTQETPTETDEASTGTNELPTETNELPTETNEPPTETNELPTETNELPTETNEPATYSYINKNGNTIKTRIQPPEGYERPLGNDYEEFIRNQELMPDGSPVLLYNGEEKGNQNHHVAVLSIDVGENDLQQCADAALRLRCEFLFSTGQFDRINFHLTNGDLFPYEKYRDGYRLSVNGNQTSLNQTASYDDSYATFQKYYTTLFTYAGTISVEEESTPVEKSEMQVGDIFVKGGSPGHCIIVMDMCENSNHEKMFLLGQSYMPAQQIHILKNPESDSPWYSLSDLSYPFHTPEWTFQEECLHRML